MSRLRLDGQQVDKTLFDYQLSFLDHVHELDADERGLRRGKRFEP
jgi:hypothetical protein